ncbi:regulatory protein RecX [Parabacteroides sp. Marseille-P3160]|uniref:regulatory protein RecX n=1 Tax=Parabacteroides sp. Marseille-P3160 TaxID=1917887 RepID=UPI0009BC363C|nr:regulatory protein RecX [Parabacteroides sp. Marseille-P3160]
MKEMTESEGLRHAAAYCSAAEHCRQDVEKKLTGNLPPEAIRRILDRLIRENFINEERFARSFTNDKFRFNRWGRIKIGYELQRKGISPEVIRQALDAIDGEAYESTLRKLLKERKKTVKGKDSHDCYRKLFRFASGRGFESQSISRQLKQLFKDSGDDVTDDFE